MLLHRYGIRASEGEMAYLAGTSLFGTDAQAIARALQQKVRERGWQARARRSEYEECARRREPFLAHVQGPDLGHAVLVERMGGEQVEVVDPLEGSPRRLSREEFEGAWDGTVVEIVRSAE
jgi:ABC-type bacteriocin/lantibiotic exporter with double-glycine peptidase domain